jgi:hypothetical protein
MSWLLFRFSDPGRASSIAGAMDCQTCPRGKFAAVSGATDCTPCAVGSFANLTGQTVCL